jgi:hypothetical protein
MQRIHFGHIITGDENWFYFEHQHASQWSVSRGEGLQRVDPAIGTAKFMFTAILGVNGFHLLNLMPSECRSNAQYFVEHVMTPWFRRSSNKGGLGILLDSMFISTTALLTSQKGRNSFSSRISCCMFPTNLMVPT